MAKTEERRPKSGPLSSVVAFTNTSFRSDANPLNLNDLIVKNPNSTFFMKVEGEDWAEQGVYPGDVLVIDRSLTPKQGDTLVVEVGGGFELSTAVKLKDKDVTLWGVVTYTLHKRRR